MNIKIRIPGGGHITLGHDHPLAQELLDGRDYEIIDNQIVLKATKGQTEETSIRQRLGKKTKATLTQDDYNELTYYLAKQEGIID